MSAVGNQAKCNINARHRRDNYISGDENKSKLVEFIFSKWSIWGLFMFLLYSLLRYLGGKKNNPKISKNMIE